jgi:transposase
MTTPQMAMQLGLSTRTIRRWLAQEHFPEQRQRRRRPSLIDPYESYVLMRWQQGCCNGLQLWREIAARGYSGSPKAFYNYLARLRPASMPAQLATSSASRKPKKARARSGPSDPFLTKRAVRLLLRRPTELTSTEQETLQMLREMHPLLEVVYKLS